MKKVFPVALMALFALLLSLVFLSGHRGLALAFLPPLFMESEQTAAATIYHHGLKKSDISYLVSHVDTMLLATEMNHGLDFRHKVQIVICARDEDFYSSFDKSYAMAAFFPRGRILIPPSSFVSAMRNKNRFERYMMHELSHALLFQNMNPLRALWYPQWLFEGMAVYAAEQNGRDWMLTMREAGRILGEKDPALMRSFRRTLLSGMGKSSADEVRKDYSLWGAKVTLLIKEHGKKRFFDFLKNSLSLRSFDSVYENYFGENPDDLRGSDDSGAAENRKGANSETSG